MPRDSDGFTTSDAPPLWGTPDMSVLRTNRRAAPSLPLDAFGPAWKQWIEGAADAAACPPDYVALPLLASASALIGNARWAQAGSGWCEPPHLWTCVVGDSGSSKSPGADCLLRDVLPEIERRMQGDFPDRLREWKAADQSAKAANEQWQAEVKAARKEKLPPPLPPEDATPPAPAAPRVLQSDVTVERVATLLATAAPKGLLITRDEFVGWLLGMNAYHDAGRAFWIEAYGGKPFRVERQKHPEPINVPRLTVAAMGGTQPDRLAELFRDADDGLFARIVWAWPEAIPFRLGCSPPGAAFAIAALDRLRALDMASGEDGAPPRPVMVPVQPALLPMVEAFACDMQARQADSGGLLRSAYGKARGLALRLAVVLAHLHWCAAGAGPAPGAIGEDALTAACDLTADYFMAMAERVYGDAGATMAERNAATLARWIKRERPATVHVRSLQRDIRLPGLNTADAIHAAAAELVDAHWLREPAPGGFQRRSTLAYPVNPTIAETVP